MELPIYKLDAFSSTLFGGNPAAVVLLTEWLPDATLQSIAAENNLSETAFVVRGRGDFEIRWFTPTVEVDLCGHATLATGSVLLSHEAEVDRVRFRTRKSGELTVSRHGDLLALDFPERRARPVPAEVGLEAALRVTPVEVHAARDLMVVVADEDVVRGLDPDPAAVAGLDAFAVTVTAPGRHSDFVSRFFAPRAGIPEDPVTGSAHCTLVPYWSARLGKTKLHALQLSARGGELFCEHRGERVIIAGRVVEYLRGTISV